MRTFVLMISLFVMLLFSCENRQYINTYSNRVDSLVFVLNTYTANYNNFDTARIHHRLGLTDSLLLISDSHDNIFNSDSVRWIKLIKKGFEEFLLAYPSINNELMYAQSQLNTFKHDLEKEYLTKESAIIYFEQEKQSVYILQLKVDYYTELIKLNNDRYRRLETKLAYLTQKETQ